MRKTLWFMKRSPMKLRRNSMDIAVKTAMRPFSICWRCSRMTAYLEAIRSSMVSPVVGLLREPLFLRMAISEPGGMQVWIYDISRDTLTRLTFEGNANLDPVWTPDGKRIAFTSTKEGPLNIFSQQADGSGGLDPFPFELAT